MDEREAANRAAAEHVARLRRRIAEGKAEIERQHESLTETRTHLQSIRAWLEGAAQGDEEPEV